MKITIYTITDCQFSAQEKEYLNAHSLPFEEKNLETNREFLTEMLTVSNNFAGTPVTKIEKDDGQIAVLKGFTKEEFDKELGTTAAPAADMNTPAAVPPAPVVPPMEQSTPAPEVPMATPPPMNNDMNTGAPAAPPMASTDAAAPTLTPLSSPMPTAPNIPDMSQTLDKLSGMGQAPTPVAQPPAAPPADPISMAQPPAQAATPDLNNVLGNLEQKSEAPAPVMPSDTPPTIN